MFHLFISYDTWTIYEKYFLSILSINLDANVNIIKINND